MPRDRDGGQTAVLLKVLFLCRELPHSSRRGARARIYCRVCKYITLVAKTNRQYDIYVYITALLLFLISRPQPEKAKR